MTAGSRFTPPVESSYTSPDALVPFASPALIEELHEILDATMLLMEGDLGNIQLYDPAHRTLTIVAQRGFRPELITAIGRVTIDNQTAGARCLRERKRVVIRDVNADADYAPYRKFAAMAGFRAIQATPVTGRDGEFLGALLTQLREPRDFSTREMRVLDLYSRQAADAIVRARVEYELATARRRLDTALSASEIGIFDWDIPNGRVFGDANFQRMFGTTHDKDGWAPSSAFEPLIHPDDRAARTALVRKTLDTGALYESEYRIVNNGETRWVISRGRAEHNASGRAVRFLGVLLDITNQRQAERRQQSVSHELNRLSRVHNTVLSSMRDFVTVVDREGRFLYANRHLLSAWGKTLEEIAGRTRLELGYEKEHHERHMREIAQILETRQAVRGEVAYTLPSGRYGVYDYIFAPVLGADGEVESIVSTSRDVTERKQAEQALQEADRQKNAFIAQLAHELRNPLAPIRNANRVFRLGEHTNPEMLWAGEVIDRQIDHLTRLIDDLLDVSRISRNKVDLRRSRILLQDVVQGAVEISRPVIDQNGHELAIALSPEPVYLLADLARLIQVLMNLLINAAKYTPAGGRIELIAGREHGDAVMRVRDNGMGILPSMLPRLFEMFFQADSSMERSQGGLGIGLSLVKSVVELHGGTVEARSAGLGQGAEFIVRIPATGATAGPAPGPTKSDIGLAASAKRRVLVVDDNRDSAESLAIYLQLGGHEVHTAYDGEEALEHADSFRPEVILLDIGMPKLNGYEVCRRLRKEEWGRSMLIVAQTGWGQEEDKRRTREAGFDEHLVKPVDPTYVARIVAEGRRA
ncbi:MAG TPA: ATP-binding protein [Burkholderiales bacterium]|nr:ATP-binding protein [Burkholderiales bacterium]